MSSFTTFGTVYRSEHTNLLQAAKAENCTDVIRALDQKADANEKNFLGETAIMLLCDFFIKFDNFKEPYKFEAAEMEILKTLSYLHQQGGRIDEVNNYGQTALFYASANLDSENRLIWLIQRGAYVNHRDYNGNTCLHGFVRENDALNCDSQAILMVFGANPEIRNNADQLPEIDEHEVSDHICEKISYRHNVEFLMTGAIKEVSKITHYQKELQNLKKYSLTPKVNLYDFLLMKRKQIMSFIQNAHLVKLKANFMMQNTDFICSY